MALSDPTHVARAPSTTDARGYRVTGASPAAAESFERALTAFQCWHSGADILVESALQEEPGFVMAHVLRAYLLLCSRDPAIIRSARPVFEHAGSLPANDRERTHLAVIAAAAGDDYPLALDLLTGLLRQYPRDILALQLSHAFDYLGGDTEGMQAHIAMVLPGWSCDMPGYHALLAMHAFSMVESGDYGHAEESACHALELNPADARAHHVMAHVFEMSARSGDGMAWLDMNRDVWGTGTVVATHCWWHMALFQLGQGRHAEALRLYDQRVRAGSSHMLGDLIDASALLWRLHLCGVGIGMRWYELADAWAPHAEDGFCNFNDLHAMLAFVGAGDQESIDRLRQTLRRGLSRAGRYGMATRMFGMAACEGIAAFGEGDDARTLALLASIPTVMQRLGGSHAQRDVLHLTLIEAVQRMRHSGLRRRAAPAQLQLAA
jgi:tetratricopeptide (TPR) repeat protein